MGTKLEEDAAGKGAVDGAVKGGAGGGGGGGGGGRGKATVGVACGMRVR